MQHESAHSKTTQGFCSRSKLMQTCTYWKYAARHVGVSDKGPDRPDKHACPKQRKHCASPFQTLTTFAACNLILVVVHQHAGGHKSSREGRAADSQQLRR